jgi:predicted transcriptional regulator
MAEPTPLQGELQVQVMGALWRLDGGTVNEVREALPRRHRGAYTTVQTVLNRLAERGLLERRKQAGTVVYRPKLNEAEYLSRSLERALAAASEGARQAALAQLIGTLEAGEVAELRDLADEIARRRSEKRS